MKFPLPILLFVSTTALAAGLTDVVSKKKTTESRPARITAANTYYDRKEGVAIFSGHVHVDDEQYQMHAGKAYVFMGGSNAVERIVAMGGVAMTNETKRAYGSRVTYYRKQGMVVLHSDENQPAEVRDERPDGAQVVKGKKIRFWINNEQVEVLEADISAPAKVGKGAIPGLGL